MSGILFPQIAKVFLVLTMGLPDAIILKDVMVDMDPPKFSVNFNQYFEGSLDIECLHIGTAFEDRLPNWRAVYSVLSIFVSLYN